MDWKDEELDELRNLFASRLQNGDTHDEAALAVASRAVELAAVRGGTMTAEDLHIRLGAVGRGVDERTAQELRQHISAQGARNAVLEADLTAAREGLIREGMERNRLEQRVSRLEKSLENAREVVDSAKEEAEHLRERLSATEESNRELVRRAQQAEGEVDALKKALLAERDGDRQMKVDFGAFPSETLRGMVKRIVADRDSWRMLANKSRVRAEEAEARCATPSTGKQTESAPPDLLGAWGSPAAVSAALKASGYGAAIAQRYPCSPTCTHDDAAKPGHPERVEERSEAVKVSSCPHSAQWVVPVGATHYECSECHQRVPDDLIMRVMTQTQNWGDATKEAIAYERGSESMRAACWEAVQGVLASALGIDSEDASWHAVKAAIEGVVP